MQGVNTVGSSVIKGASGIQAKNELEKFFGSSSGGAAGPADGRGQGDALPGRADIGGKPDTSGLAPAFISPNTPPMDFGNISGYNLPDISTQE